MAWLRLVCIILLSFLYIATIFIPTAAIASRTLFQSANASLFNGLFFKCRTLEEDPCTTVCEIFNWSNGVRNYSAAARVIAAQVFGTVMMLTGYLSLACLLILRCLIKRAKTERRVWLLKRGPKGVLLLLVVSVVSDVITCLLLAVNVEDIAIYPDARLGQGAYWLMVGSGLAVVCLFISTALLCCYFPPREKGAKESGRASSTNPAIEQTGGDDGAAHRSAAGAPVSVITTCPPDVHDVSNRQSGGDDGAAHRSAAGALDNAMMTYPSDLQDVNNRQQDGQTVKLREKNDNLNRLGNFCKYIIYPKKHEPRKSIPIPLGNGSS